MLWNTVALNPTKPSDFLLWEKANSSTIPPELEEEVGDAWAEGMRMAARWEKERKKKAT